VVIPNTCDKSITVGPSIYVTVNLELGSIAAVVIEHRSGSCITVSTLSYVNLLVEMYHYCFNDLNYQC